MIILRNLIVLAIGATILFMALRSLRAGRLKERYALIFVLTGLPFLLLALWRDGVGYLADLLDIDYRTLALIGVTTFFMLMIFKLLSIVSVQERRITTLAQQVSILMQKQGLTELPDDPADTTHHD
ncbi:MAG: hypothetical protein Kow00105_11770 [Phycisphaeraceae bacterium]